MKSSRFKPMAVAAVLWLGAALAPVAMAEETQANAQPSNASTPAAEGSTAKSGDQMVCRREAQIGSIIKKKVCRTAAEDAAARSASQDTMHEMMERNNGSSNGGG